ALDVEVQSLEDVGLAETDNKVAHTDNVFGRRGSHHILIPAKNIANKPSITMTRKIAFTTEAVVCSPSDSALPSTRSPSTQAIRPITAPINGALIRPTWNVSGEIASRNRSRKTSGGIPP